MGPASCKQRRLSRVPHSQVETRIMTLPWRLLQIAVLVSSAAAYYTYDSGGSSTYYRYRPGHVFSVGLRSSAGSGTGHGREGTGCRASGSSGPSWSSPSPSPSASASPPAPSPGIAELGLLLFASFPFIFINSVVVPVERAADGGDGLCQSDGRCLPSSALCPRLPAGAPRIRPGRTATASPLRANRPAPAPAPAGLRRGGPRQAAAMRCRVGR